MLMLSLASHPSPCFKGLRNFPQSWALGLDLQAQAALMAPASTKFVSPSFKARYTSGLYSCPLSKFSLHALHRGVHKEL